MPWVRSHCLTQATAFSMISVGSFLLPSCLEPRGECTVRSALAHKKLQDANAHETGHASHAIKLVLCCMSMGARESLCKALARLTIGKDEVGAKGRPDGRRGFGLHAALGQDLAALGGNLLLPRAEGNKPPAHRTPVADDEGRLSSVLCAPRESCRARGLLSLCACKVRGMLDIELPCWVCKECASLQASQQAARSIPAQHCTYARCRVCCVIWADRLDGRAISGSTMTSEVMAPGCRWCTPPSARALPEELLARLVSGAFGPALRLSPRTDAAALEGRAAVSSSAACTACMWAGDVTAPAPVMLSSGSTCRCTNCL